ncbi:MAG: OmpA family protein [Saprospiraceae bacterium]|nr:OmpA family protein [Saprospiraceae bacterium]MBK7812243.1 OmpA family protein [Saprospiraceae bacterium]
MKGTFWLLTITIWILTYCDVSAQLFTAKNGLSVRKTLYDYNSFRSQNSAAIRDFSDGFELAYVRSFSNRFAVFVPIGVGSYKDSLNEGLSSPFFSIGAQGQFHFYNSKWWINPYAVGGVQALFPSGHAFALQLPLGLGANVKLHPQVLLQAQADFRLTLKDWENHLQYTAGLVYMFDSKKEESIQEKLDSDGDGVIDDLDLCPNEKGLAEHMGCPDSDGDGIADHKDKCPNIAGLEKFVGCPDSDGDGVADNEDECPNLKGLIEFKGCPEPDQDNDGVPDQKDKCPDKAGLIQFDGCPDSDGDGIADHEDKCPDKSGKKEMGGCPETFKDSDGDGIEDKMDECPLANGLKEFNGCPDSDGDGVQDKYDSCPNVSGPKTNKGCPLIEKKDQDVLDFAMRAVQFDLGRATLKSESFSILDKISGIMKKYQDYKLEIGGHTDNTGSAGFNLELSEKRAKVCYEYLISKGVGQGRLSYVGHGQNKPIADNATEQGRFLNRRTEFTMIPK